MYNSSTVNVLWLSRLSVYGREKLPYNKGGLGLFMGIKLLHLLANYIECHELPVFHHNPAGMKMQHDRRLSFKCKV
jgi:hypothetical protein